jgi:propanediol dehydratase small subunit
VGNAIAPELEKRLIANIERTIELIEVQKEMKLALYKKLYPHKTESQLISLISPEIIRSKQHQP